MRLSSGKASPIAWGRRAAWRVAAATTSGSRWPTRATPKPLVEIDEHVPVNVADVGAERLVPDHRIVVGEPERLRPARAPSGDGRALVACERVNPGPGPGSRDFGGEPGQIGTGHRGSLTGGSGYGMYVDLDGYRVLLLDKSFRPLRALNWRRAILLDLAGRVEVLQYYDRKIRTASASFSMPAVMRSPNWVERSPQVVALTRRNVLLRDGNTCVYCGFVGVGRELTIDHVLPRSRGGAAPGRTWSRPAVRATVARATGPPKRPGCASASSRARRAPCRSGARGCWSPATLRRSGRPGCAEGVRGTLGAGDDVSNEAIQEAWADHAGNPEGVAHRLGEWVARAGEDEVQPLAGLVVHVFGEHLGRWDEGLRLLGELTPRAGTNPANVQAVLRATATLRCCAGDADLDDLMSRFGAERPGNEARIPRGGGGGGRSAGADGRRGAVARAGGVHDLRAAGRAPGGASGGRHREQPRGRDGAASADEPGGRGPAAVGGLARAGRLGACRDLARGRARRVPARDVEPGPRGAVRGRGPRGGLPRESARRTGRRRSSCSSRRRPGRSRSTSGATRRRRGSRGTRRRAGRRRWSRTWRARWRRRSAVWTRRSGRHHRPSRPNGLCNGCGARRAHTERPLQRLRRAFCTCGTGSAIGSGGRRARTERCVQRLQRALETCGTGAATVAEGVGDVRSRDCNGCRGRSGWIRVGRPTRSSVVTRASRGCGRRGFTAEVAEGRREEPSPRDAERPVVCPEPALSGEFRRDPVPAEVRRVRGGTERRERLRAPPPLALPGRNAGFGRTKHGGHGGEHGGHGGVADGASEGAQTNRVSGLPLRGCSVAWTADAPGAGGRSSGDAAAPKTARVGPFVVPGRPSP